MAKKPGFSYYKLIRWTVLIVLVLGILFALRRPALPALPQTATEIKQNAESFESKLNELESSKKHGESGEAHFTSDEVNAFVQDASQRARQISAAGNAGGTGENTSQQPSENAAPPQSDSTAAQVQADVKDTQVAFVGDEVIAQAVTQRYGKDVYVTVRGHLGAENGYLKFTPTGFKIGDLAVPVSLVEGRLQEKLDEPENKQKLKLPEFIRDLRIQNGELVVVER
jgi:hypothetical protein